MAYKTRKIRRRRSSKRLRANSAATVERRLLGPAIRKAVKSVQTLARRIGRGGRINVADVKVLMVEAGFVKKHGSATDVAKVRKALLDAEKRLIASRRTPRPKARRSSKRRSTKNRRSSRRRSSRRRSSRRRSSKR